MSFACEVVELLNDSSMYLQLWLVQCYVPDRAGLEAELKLHWARVALRPCMQTLQSLDSVEFIEALLSGQKLVYRRISYAYVFSIILSGKLYLQTSDKLFIRSLI